MNYILALLYHRQTSKYSIHGLWPQIPNVQWPEYCTTKKFNLSELDKTTRRRLKQVWYSYDKDDEHFWKHEFEKHGTCSGLSESQYFAKVLDLYDKAIQLPKYLESIRHGNNVHIPVSSTWELLQNAKLKY